MPYSEPSVHHVTVISAEAHVDPAAVTLTFSQTIPRWEGVKNHREDATLAIYLSEDQDAADAYMLASAILAAQSSYDTIDQRRIRAAIALGWRPTVHPKSGELTGWERPWREGDQGSPLLDSDTELHAKDVGEALANDLDAGSLVNQEGAVF